MNEGNFNLRLEARVKNGSLVGAREQMGLTQKEVAKSMGVSCGYYNGCENMRLYPSQENQAKICGFYRDNGIFLFEDDVFPEELRNVKSRKHIVEREIPKSKLISLSTINHKELPYVRSKSHKILEEEELRKRVEEVFDTLTFREREVVKLRYGIGDGYTYTLEEVGRKFSVTREMVRYIEAKALRKLQESRLLQEFFEDEPTELFPETQEEINRRSVYDFDEISIRTGEALVNSNIQTIGALCNVSEADLLGNPKLGQTAIIEIKNLLNQQGFSLKQD